MTSSRELAITRKLVEIDLILKGTTLRPKKVSDKKQRLINQLTKTRILNSIK